jgi:hypothetical protein
MAFSRPVTSLIMRASESSHYDVIERFTPHGIGG